MVTPIRKFRVDNELWAAASARADIDGISVSDVIRQALERFTAGLDADAKPDAVSYLVRYDVRTPRGARKPWQSSDTGPLAESVARKFFREWPRKPSENMRGYELVRREEYVIDRVK